MRPVDELVVRQPIRETRQTLRNSLDDKVHGDCISDFINSGLTNFAGTIYFEVKPLLKVG